MVAWTNEDWQANILYDDLKNSHETLRGIFMEELLGKLSRKYEWRDNIVSYFIKKYSLADADKITIEEGKQFCHKRILEAEKCLREGGRYVPPRTMWW